MPIHPLPQTPPPPPSPPQTPPSPPNTPHCHSTPPPFTPDTLHLQPQTPPPQTPPTPDTTSHPPPPTPAATHLAVRDVLHVHFDEAFVTLAVESARALAARGRRLVAGLGTGETLGVARRTRRNGEAGSGGKGLQTREDSRSWS